MEFKESHEAFLRYHQEKRSGDRLIRLKQGHGHAEKLFLQKVWWPAFRNLHDLNPEYEVYDFKDGKRYLDFAYIRPPIRICIEVDGYGPHWQDMSRKRFGDDRMRQNHLEIDGWMVIRFAYDDIVEHPRRCQQVVQQMIGRWGGEHNTGHELNHFEKEIIRACIRTGAIVSLQDIRKLLEISEKTARKILRGMVEKGVLRPIGGAQRTHSYELNPDKINRFF